MRTAGIKLALAAGVVVGGVAVGGGRTLAQQGQDKPPELTVYKSPT